MSLRWKIALALASITLVATTAIGVAAYRSTRQQLYAEVDRSLVEAVGRIGRGGLPQRGPLSGYEAQLIRGDGFVVESTFDRAQAPSATALEVVGSEGSSRFENVDVDGDSYRIRTIGIERGAVQVARPLDEAQRVLSGLRIRIALLTLLVAGAAAAVGLWLAGRVTASLRRLTDAAERVGTTGRIDGAGTVDVSGTDEVGRLAAAFDRMLAALAGSQEQQRRLVQDAGHELRTPLTSLRTNVATLRRYPDLSDGDRSAILADLQAETEELSGLVDEIVTVASGDSLDEPPVDLDLVEMATEVVQRHERRSGRRIVVVGSHAPVIGQRAALQRAVSCLLDNATKFDRSDGPIEVAVTPGGVTVADRGPGIREGELTVVFERFHRAEEARSEPGSGLGLSIVRDIARRHGGDAFARPRDGGGAVVGFTVGFTVASLPPTTAR